ncbi:MAG: type II/IV secretion system family protein, partial [Micavibrio sp.]
NADELAALDIPLETPVRTHNGSGCDLCNRTGIAGRTLLLDAMLITLGPGQRNEIYEALTNNVNQMVHEEGIVVHTRREGLIDLIRSGLVDPKAGVSYLEQ